MSRDQSIVSKVEGDLPTRKEYCDAASVSRRRVGWAFAVLFVGLLLSMLIIVLIGAQLDAAGFPKDSLWKVAIFTLLFPVMFTGIWLVTLVQRHPLLQCSRCCHRHESGIDCCYSIVTRRCPKCANLLFGEARLPTTEPIEANDEQLIRRLDLLSSRSRDVKAAWKAVRPRLFVGLVLLGIGGIFGPWLTDLLAPQLGEIWTPFIAPLCFFPGVSFTLWSLVGSRRQITETEICPRCATPFSTRNYVSVTGNCSACGERAVSDPHPGLEPSSHESSHTMWSLEEFIKLTKQRHDHLWIGCFIGAGCGAIWLIPFFIFDIPPEGTKNASTSELVIFFAYFCGMMITQLSGTFLWNWYSARDIRCPECRSELLQMYRLVVSSKRCYRCGTDVIAHEQSHLD